MVVSYFLGFSIQGGCKYLTGVVLNLGVKHHAAADRTSVRLWVNISGAETRTAFSGTRHGSNGGGGEVGPQRSGDWCGVGVFRVIG